MTLLKPPGDDGIIPRNQMPQVDPADIPVLLSYLGSLDVSFSAGLIDPAKVAAHQLVDEQKAMAIPDSVMAFPVLLSKEPAIIDGDHRWYAHLMEKRDMPFIRFDKPFLVIVRMIFTFPKTYKETGYDDKKVG